MDELLTIKETAKVLKVNPNYVYKLINRGLLPALILGSKKVRRKSLEEFLVTYDGMDLSDFSNIKALTG